MAKKQKTMFSTRKHPGTGIISVILAVVCVFFLLILFFLSGLDKGASDQWIGFAGIIVFIMAVIGFILAAKCYKKEDVYMTTPTIGSVVNGIIIVALMLLYVVGAT